MGLQICLKILDSAFPVMLGHKRADVSFCAGGYHRDLSCRKVIRGRLYGLLRKEIQRKEVILELSVLERQVFLTFNRAAGNAGQSKKAVY
jgi:hypothetical protein